MICRHETETIWVRRFCQLPILLPACPESRTPRSAACSKELFNLSCVFKRSKVSGTDNKTAGDSCIPHFIPKWGQPLLLGLQPSTLQFLYYNNSNSRIYPKPAEGKLAIVTPWYHSFFSDHRSVFPHPHSFPPVQKTCSTAQVETVSKARGKQKQDPSPVTFPFTSSTSIQ